MHPVLFQWRGLTVYSYPAMLYIGLVAGVVAGNAAAHAAGLDAFRAYVATLVLVAPALIGARLWHVACHWQLYRKNLRRIWDRNDSGYAMYGGLPVILLLSVPLLAALQLPFGAFWDVGTFTLLVGMIFARMGCLMNGCCAGRPSRSWLSVYLPNCLGLWQRRIPTQCLEAGWGAVVLVFAVTMWRWMPFPGALFLFVTAGYACGRLLLESTRESQTPAARFTNYAISVVLILVALATLTILWPRQGSATNIHAPESPAGFADPYRSGGT